MTRIRLLSPALFIAATLIGASAHAQQTQPGETPPAQVESHGTAPGGMGSGKAQTGTSTVQTTGSGAVAGSSADDQPLMATGQDLRGPPMRFPANKTPE